MESEFQHSVLVVEGDGQIKKTIASLLKDKPITAAFCDTGEAALEEIKSAARHFSVIISAQSLAGMPGTCFLENAQKTAPDSIRFLMANYSEMETLINAINQSAIHRFFVKPFENQDFLKAIGAALRLYTAILEHERLFKLAKKQNTRLFDLNCELMEATKTYNMSIQSLDGEIKGINDDIGALTAGKPDAGDTILKKMTNYIRVSDGVDPEKAKALFSSTILTLYDRFDELAHRNGFEMPRIKGDTE